MRQHAQHHNANHHEENDIYRKLVQLRPELRSTALLVERARERCTYPIRSRDELLALADPGHTHCDLDGVKLGSRELKRFFPKNLFPIEDEDALIGRLIAVFIWGNEVHNFEAKMAAASKEMK